MIDQDNIYAYFDDNHGPLGRPVNGWYVGECPFCRSRKLSLNPELSHVKCWKGCFKGYVVSFVQEYLACSYIDAYTILADLVPKLQLSKYMKTHTIRKDISLPEGYKPILWGRTPMAKRARSYLRGRGFDLNYLDMIGVGYCGEGPYFGYLIIPFKRDGEVVYFIGRDFLNRGDKVRYKNPSREEFGIGKAEVLFNEEALYKFEEVYLLEGWTDAATIGNNAVSIQGKALSDIQRDVIVKAPVKEIIVIADVGAEMEALSIAEKLYLQKKVKLLTLTGLPGKDVNEIGVELVLAREGKYITTLNDFYEQARSINPHKKKLLN